VTTVAAGAAPAPAPAPSSSNNARDVVIGAAVIGLVIWALGGFGPSSSVAGSVSTQGDTSGTPTGPAKGKVLGRY